MGSNFIDAKDAVGRAYRSFLNIPAPPTADEQLVYAIQTARKDYQVAEQRFNEARDQDLVDQAIYDMLSAKTRYAYLLKQAKEQDIRF